MPDVKKLSEINGKKFLQEAFNLEQQKLYVELDLSSKSITHSGKKGDVNEQHFIKILKQYLPKRYEVHSGIVIDSKGQTSDQIDIIIYDPQYTPTLLDQENHRYIPAEAVYAVMEVKPTINKSNLQYAAEKAESVRKLKRTSVDIMHSDGMKKAKQLFPIIAGIISSDISWQKGFDNNTFRKHHKSYKQSQQLDCGLAASGSSFDVYENTYKYGPTNQALTFFLFRLLGKLQVIGTVPAVDWTAYASVLSKK